MRTETQDLAVCAYHKRVSVTVTRACADSRSWERGLERDTLGVLCHRMPAVFLVLHVRRMMV
jgi:hypothetical protein